MRCDGWSTLRLVSGGREDGMAYQRKRKMVMDQIMVVDHIATASVWSLRFLGIFAGTNLIQGCVVRKCWASTGGRRQTRCAGGGL